MAITNLSSWNEDDLIKALKKACDELHPIIIYINPQDEELLTKTLGDLLERVEIMPCNIVEKGKAYAFDKRYIKAEDLTQDV